MLATMELGFAMGLSCLYGTKYIFFAVCSIAIFLALAPRPSFVETAITNGLMLRRWAFAVLRQRQQ
jgi:hypothetical protein